jgi:broad specificity phosphatase PhoE
VVLEVLVVQHGEKERLPGDPGLTDLGREQAVRAAEWIGERTAIDAVWCSPLRRAVETAAPLVEHGGLDLVVDERLRERMNWEGPDVQPFEEFLTDWARVAADRTYQPRYGDSSLAAADRFLAALDDLRTAHPTGAVAVVTHGGVTVDALRTLLGDGPLRAAAPQLLDVGVPPGAITRLRYDAGDWTVLALPQAPPFDQ